MDHLFNVKSKNSVQSYILKISHWFFKKFYILQLSIQSTDMILAGSLRFTLFLFFLCSPFPCVHLLQHHCWKVSFLHSLSISPHVCSHSMAPQLGPHSVPPSTNTMPFVRIMGLRARHHGLFCFISFWRLFLLLWEFPSTQYENKPMPQKIFYHCDRNYTKPED